MNKKYSISAIVLIALMSLALIPMRASAYDLNPNNGPVYSTIGPSASSILCLCYTDPTAEFAAFQSGQIDFMDGPLTPTQYPLVAPPGHDQYAVAGPIGQYSLYDYDMNDAVYPFNKTEYRMGLSCLIDKADFVNTYLPGAAGPAWGPLFSYGASWSDTTLYNQYQSGGSCETSFIKAYEYFCTAFGAPTEDTFVGSVGQTTYPAGHWSTWKFTSPFPNTGPSGEPAVMDNHISIYARTTGADAETRTAQGIYVRDRCVTLMPEFFSYAGNQTALNTTLQSDFPSNWENYVIPRDGSGHLLLPRVDIDDYPEPRSNTATWVMEEYTFMLYTGGWSLGIEPGSTITGWITSQDPAHKGGTPGVPNYESYENPAYDITVAAYLASATPAAGSILSKQAEDQIMADQGIISMWYDAGYQACLSSEQRAIVTVGTGWFGWWTWFDAYPGSNAFISSPGLASNSLYWGWSSDFQNLNIISSQWVWDYYVMNEIYEGLLTTNPYSTSDIIGQLATAWSYDASHTDWAHTIGSATLRTDVYWQNVPFMHREAFTPDHGTELNGPMTDIKFTPLDFAFTCQYLRDQDMYQATWNGIAVDDVQHVEVSSVYNVTGSIAYQMSQAALGLCWPWWNATAFPNGPAWENVTWINDPNGAGFTGYHNDGGWDYPAPFVYQNDFVQFNPAMPANQVKVYLYDDMTWLLYYRAFLTYVLPMHIFMNLPVGSWTNNGFTTSGVLNDRFEAPSIIAGSMDLLYGTGPFILTSGVRGQQYRMVANIAGASWVGGGGQSMTENHGYYWSPLVKPAVTSGGTDVTVDYTDTGLVFDTTLVNSGAQTNIDYFYEYSVYKMDPATGAYTVPAESGSTPVVNNHATPSGTSHVGASIHIAETFGDQISASVSFIYTIGGITYTAGVPSQYFNLGATAPESTVGITGYGLIFNTTLTNSYTSALSMDYHWNYAVYKYNDTSSDYDIPVASGSTSTVTGFSVATTGAVVTGTVALPTSLAYNDSIRATVNFAYVENSSSHLGAAVVLETNMWPADISGHRVVAPFYGSDGSVDSSDLHTLGVTWGTDSSVVVAETANNPASDIARANINKDDVIDSSDLHIMGVEWGLLLMTPPEY